MIGGIKYDFCVLQRLIWFALFAGCPTKRTICLYGLRYCIKAEKKSIFRQRININDKAFKCKMTCSVSIGEHCSAVYPRVVNLGTTTKLCLRNYVPKPYPGHIVVVSRPKIGLGKVGVTFILVLFYN